jgi:pseudouridine-5'-phosphate glycosidase
MALHDHPVAVICAGAKAFLDLPRTVEALETYGIPVYGYQTDCFPAFYRRQTDLMIDGRFDSVENLSRAIQTHWRLGFASGVLVVHPIPEKHELPKDLYERALAQALALAKKNDVRGRELTPFLLSKFDEFTHGKSVVSNVELLRNNARLAAGLAAALLK